MKIVLQYETRIKINIKLKKVAHLVLYFFYDHSFNNYSCHFIFTLVQKQCYVSTESISNEATCIPGCLIHQVGFILLLNLLFPKPGKTVMCDSRRLSVYLVVTKITPCYKAILMKFSELLDCGLRNR